MSEIPKTMSAVLLTGHGGYDKLEYRDDVPVPEPDPGDVLIKVGAAGVNNTDINTRIGWYSKNVTGDTEDAATDEGGQADDDDASWSGVPLTFPRIQGGDCCGHIVAVGDGVDKTRIGQRVMVNNMLRSYVDYRPMECWFLGSEIDGAFAQYMKAPSVETHAVDCDWSDADLASIPCSYSTAENQLHRTDLKQDETILITGASGGVGSATIQLAKRRGARVVAICGASKAEQVKELGADVIVHRGENITKALGHNSVDVVYDLVAGPQWPQLLEVLKPGGRYGVSGAIAGPMVELDVRTLYLKDLTFYGSTFQHEHVLQELIGYIERGEIKPLVSATYPLKDIAQAQEDFLAKKYVGKLVLIP